MKLMDWRVVLHCSCCRGGTWVGSIESGCLRRDEMGKVGDMGDQADFVPVIRGQEIERSCDP